MMTGALKELSAAVATSLEEQPQRCQLHRLQRYYEAFLQRPASHNEQYEDEVEESDSGDIKKNRGTKYCELQEKFPIAFVLGGAIIGIGHGIGLSFWQPDNPSTKDAAMTWIGLIGNHIIRALMCIIMPLVFVSKLSEQGTISVGPSGCSTTLQS